MDVVSLPAAIEADEFFLVFHRHTDYWWLRPIGRYKHISAFAYVPGFKCWYLYDVQIAGTRVMHFSHDEWLGRSWRIWTRDSDMVKIKRLDAGPKMIRFFFYCGPAIKHLIGLRCLALRPDAIYRQVIRRGGVPVEPEKTAAPSG